jgi:hypothetical protein
VTVNPAGGSGDKEGRDSACTPKWLAELLGKFDLDPCSNPRSHVQAQKRLMLESGDDGLWLYDKTGEPGLIKERQIRGKGANDFYGIDRTAIIGKTCYVFINPPYARGQVIRWVKHWRHTRFCFLLRWDPSTEWFGELICHCTHVWFPARRINFEPPPGVTFSSNPFPHALYLRDPDQEMLDRLSTAGYLMPVDQDLLALYLDADDRPVERTDGPGKPGEGAAKPAGGGGKGAGGGDRQVGQESTPTCECIGCKTGVGGCAFKARTELQKTETDWRTSYSKALWEDG